MQRPWGRSDLGLFENGEQASVVGRSGIKGGQLVSGAYWASQGRERKVLAFRSEHDGRGGDSSKIQRCLAFVRNHLLEAAMQPGLCEDSSGVP